MYCGPNTGTFDYQTEILDLNNAGNRIVTFLNYQSCKDESCAKDVDCLRELLNHVTPNKTDNSKENDDNARQVLGPSLTVKVLKNNQPDTFCFVLLIFMCKPRIGETGIFLKWIFPWDL